MQRDIFERSLRAFSNRVPFAPYTIEFTSGSVLRVDHPEAMVSRNGVAVHFSPDGIPTLFDFSTVARLTGTVDVASVGG